MTTPRLGAPELVLSQGVPETTVNEQIRYVEQSAGHFTFKSRATTAQPGSPTDGDCYLLTGSPTGAAWSTQANKVAFYLNTAWVFRTPKEGWGAWVNDEDVFILYDGAAWGEIVPDISGTSVGDHSDVDLTGLADGDVMVFDSGSGDFIAAPLPGGGGGGGTVPDGGELGTVLTKQSAADQDVAWSWPGYEGGPPGDVPTVASFSWINQDTSTATDGTGAIIFKPQANDEWHYLVKAVPTAPFDIYCRVDMFSLSTAANTSTIFVGGSIVLRDSSDSEVILMSLIWDRVAGDEQNTYSAVVGRRTADITFNATVHNKLTGQLWKWMRVNVGTTTLTFYVSLDGRNWHSIGTEPIATFIDTVNQYGIGAVGSTNSTETVVQFSYFSTTAPV